MFFAQKVVGYDHFSKTISELGEYGSGYDKIVSFGVFLPVALISGIVAWLLRETHTPIALLALSIAIGYGVSAVFPCDPGSPLVGSVRQAVHNLGGGIEYIGGTLSLFWIAEYAGTLFRFAGGVVVVTTVLLSFKSPFRGAIQRIAEFCLFASLVIALWTVNSHRYHVDAVANGTSESHIGRIRHE